MLKIWLIRHGMTEGNRHQRYIGVTDEPLCEEGRKLLRKFTYPKPQAVFVSPLKRCLETAAILFDDPKVRIIDQLAECNFGEFENKNYKELSGDPRYQAWIDSGGTIGFPGGEDQKAFCDRVQTAFEACIRDDVMPKVCNWRQTYASQNAAEAALVVHGGTIMNIMEKYALPKKEFYEWHIGNGCGYLVELDPVLWKKDRRNLKLLGEQK